MEGILHQLGYMKAPHVRFYMSVVGSSHIFLDCLVGFYHMVNLNDGFTSTFIPGELRGIKKEWQDFLKLPSPKENLDAPRLATLRTTWYQVWDNVDWTYG